MSWILNSKMVRSCLNGKLALAGANILASPLTTLAPLVASSTSAQALLAHNIMSFMTISSQRFQMLNLVALLSLPLMAAFGVSSLPLVMSLSYLMMTMNPFPTFTQTGLLTLNFALVSAIIAPLASTLPLLSRCLLLRCRLRLPGETRITFTTFAAATSPQPIYVHCSRGSQHQSYYRGRRRRYGNRFCG